MNERVEAWLNRWLGPPAPFPKMLAAFLCLLVASYVHAFPEIESSLIGILNASTLFLLGTATLFAGIVLLLLSVLDFSRPGSLKEKFLGFGALVLGFFLLDAMQQLADVGRQPFLEAFVTTLVGVLIALAVDSKGLRSGR